MRGVACARASTAQCRSRRAVAPRRPRCRTPWRRTRPRRAPVASTSPHCHAPHLANRPALLPWSYFAPSDDALLLQRQYLIGGQSKPATVDLFVVLADRWAGHRCHTLRAVQPQRGCRYDDVAKLRMLDPLQHAAAVHMRIVHHLWDSAHRRAWNAILLRRHEYLVLAERLCPRRHDIV